MDPRDLLFTNQFIPVETLDEKQIESDKNNYFPFVKLKEKSINNVEDEIINRDTTSSSFVKNQRNSKIWDQGSLGNQRPTLSKFTRDIVEDSYFETKKTRINVDSKMRDFKQYPLPNRYNFYLNKKYQHVTSIKLLEYDFKNFFFPINKRNNRITFFTPPPSSLLSATIFGSDIPIVDNFLSNSSTSLTNYIFPFAFQFLTDKATEVEEQYKIFVNNIKKSYFSFTIPPGFYTIEALEKTIEEHWNELMFYNSFYFTGPTEEPFLEPTPVESEVLNYSQLVKVKIDPITHVFKTLLRYEEFKINYLKTVRGENYIEFELNYPTNVANDIFLNNNTFAIVPTGFPSIGGVKETNINFVEFFPKELVDSNEVIWGSQNYYEQVSTNVFRLYFFRNINTIFNLTEQQFNLIPKIPLKFSSDETITYSCECNQLINALIGRETPFFFITSRDNVFNKFFLTYANCFLNILPNQAQFEECPKEYIIFSDNDKNKITESITNTDCSSNLLVSYLGFPFDIEGVGILSNGYQSNYGVSFSYGINTNLIYTKYNFLKLVAAFALLNQNNINFQNCYYKTNSEPEPNFRELMILPFDPPNKLPILLGDDGIYYFYNTDYIFMRLEFNSEVSANLIQGKPTPNYGFSSDETYEDVFESINNFKYQMVSYDPLTTLPKTECDNAFNISLKADGIIEKSNKNINNLFAILPLNKLPQKSNKKNNLSKNELLLYGNEITDLDTLKITFLDYEGKIIDLNWDHSLLLEISEKIEILKETNINSRTGYVNSTNIRPS